MFDLGSVIAHVKADITDFNSKISQVKSSVSKTTSGFNDLGSSIYSFTSKAAMAFGALAVGTTGFALKNAAQIELLRTSFDTLLGSAEKGRDLFSKLQKMANVTPFETDDLAKSAQVLLSFGMSVEDVLPTLSRLGDVSLGNKEKFNSLTLAFGQIRARGALMGDDLRQLIAVGFNPLQKISVRTGESMASLTEKMSEGKISFDMVNEEFIKATDNGGQFFGGMEKGSKTLSGLWSTLSDNAKITARSIVGLSETGDIIQGGLFDKVKMGVERMIVWISANKDAIVAWGQAFFTTLFTVGAQVIQIIGSIINYFREHKLAMDILIGVLVGGFVIALIAVIAYIGGFIAGIIALVGWVGILVGIIAGAVAVIVRNWKDATETVKIYWSIMTQWFAQTGHNIGRALGNVWDAITSPFKKAFDWIKGGVGSVVDALKRLNPFTKHSPSLVDLVTRGTGAIRDRYSDMFHDITDMATSLTPQLNSQATLIGAPASLPAQASMDLITINALAFMGTPTEARRLAEMVEDERMKIKRAKGV